MITKYITGITTSFSPFNPRSGKTIRNFLASLPPNARSTMRIGVKMLGQKDAAKPAMLDLTFSMSLSSLLFSLYVSVSRNKCRETTDQLTSYAKITQKTGGR